MFSASMQPLTVKTTSPFAALRIFSICPTLKYFSAAQLLARTLSTEAIGSPS
jgi:hypothetical protein